MINLITASNTSSSIPAALYPVPSLANAIIIDSMNDISSGDDFSFPAGTEIFLLAGTASTIPATPSGWTSVFSVTNNNLRSLRVSRRTSVGESISTYSSLFDQYPYVAVFGVENFKGVHQTVTSVNPGAVTTSGTIDNVSNFTSNSIKLAGTYVYYTVMDGVANGTVVDPLKTVSLDSKGGYRDRSPYGGAADFSSLLDVGDSDVDILVRLRNNAYHLFWFMEIY